MKDLILASYFDIGGRELYEDRVEVRQLKTAGHLNLTVAIVADGVGGAQNGEQAAQIAIDSIYDYLTQQGTEQNMVTLLNQAVYVAHLNVLRAGTNNSGAATTVSVAAIQDGHKLFVANVGDSRVYLFRDRQLHQLTLDQSFANMAPLLHGMSPQAAAAHPSAEVLVSILGRNKQPKIDTGIYLNTTAPKAAAREGDQGLILKPGDSVLVCSDGLIKKTCSGSPTVTENEIKRTLSMMEGQKAVRTLVSYALGRQPDDNISIALMQKPPKKQRRRRSQTWIYTLISIFVLIFALLGLYLTEEIFGRVDALNQDLAERDTALMAVETQMTKEASVYVATRTNLENEIAVMAGAQGTLELELVQTNAAQLCLTAAGYIIEVSSPTYSPEAPFVLDAGERQLPDATPQVSWTITNNGQCSLTNLTLLSDLGEGSITPRLMREGELIERLGPGESAALVLDFSTETLDDWLNLRERFNSGNEAWHLIVSTAAGELLLHQATPLLLNDSGQRWIVIISSEPLPGLAVAPDQTASPQPTMTATPTTTTVENE